MKRFLCSFLSILFVIGIWFSVPVTASAANTGIEYLGTYEIETKINPLYKGLIDESEIITNIPKTYYSDETFDETKYSSDKEVSASKIREGMEDRESTIVFYYKSETEYTTNTEFGALLDEIQEIAFKENDKPTQGDSLRYGYKSYSANIEGVTKTDETGNKTYYYKFTAAYTYYTTAAEEAELTEAVETVLASFRFEESATEKEKSDVIYNYITSTVSYDYTNLNNEAYYLKFTPYAALINKTAVCQGYAMLYYRFAEEAGLDARIVSGTSNSQNHAWNIVKLGEAYYYLDSTWDAGYAAENYNYYLKGSTVFGTSHINEARFETDEFKASYAISDTDYVSETFSGVENGFKYTVTSGVATVEKYVGTNADVVVPSTLGGAPVYYVSACAFDKVYTMTSLTFSEGIKSMESEAINTCSNLTTINFPSTMTIGFERYNDPVITGYSTAPIYCDAVKTVTVAENNPYIKVKDGIIYTVDETAVVYCPPALNLTNITLSDKVVDIAPRAFDSSYKLKSITLPETLKGIGELAFCNCTALEAITLPGGCVYLGQFALINSGLTSINIPKDMKRLSGNSFQNTLLKTITVDENNETFYLDNGALRSANTIYTFAKGTAITRFAVPEDVSVIEQCAFQNTELEEIVLHNNITTINCYAFANCKQLVHIEIPSSLTVIEDYLFLNCDGLASVIIPDSVTEIGDLVFYDNNDLTIYYGTTEGKAYNYARTNQFKSKPISEFKCSIGHNMEYVCDANGYRYACSVCGDSAKNNPLKSISVAQATLVETEFVYGNINPVIKTITYGGEVLVEGEDYTVSKEFGIYPGTQYLTVIGINEFCDELNIPFTVTAGDISDKKVTLSFYEHEYTGFSLEPTVTVEGLVCGTDYEVSFKNNIEVGTATVTITGIYTHYGTITKTFEIKKIDITQFKDYLYLETDYYEYDGTAKYPEISWVSLVENKDFTISYSNNINAGTATVTLNGIGNYKGTISTTFTIGPKYVNSEDVNIEYTEVSYDGKAKCPEITIAGLTEGVDFDVQYSNNTEIGYGNARVVCKGNYTGEFNLEFQIITSHTHSYTVSETKAATCTTDGQETYLCSCGESYTKTIPATGHTTSVINAKLATCTQDGYSGDTYCSVCKTTIEKGSVINSTGHTTSLINEKEATTEEAGYTGDVYCSVCKTVIEKGTEIPKLLNLSTPAVTFKNTSKGIQVNWNAINGAESYIVYRSEYNPKTQKWSKWASIKSGVTEVTYTDTTVKIGTSYKYTVRAVNGDVKSKYADTKGLKYDVIPTVKVANASNGIKVSWSTVANATGYTVYRSEYKNGTWTKWASRGTAKANVTSWTDKKVKSGVQYKYTVRACNGKTIKSSYNKNGSATLFLAQPTVKIANNATGVKVSWSKVSGATGYTVYRSEYKNGAWTKWASRGTAKANKSSWVDTKVTSGVQYKYTVRAINGKYKSTYVSSSALLYLAQPVTTVKAVSNGINVSWTESTGATGYTVYRMEYNAKTKKWSKWKNMGTAKADKKAWTDKSAKKGVIYRYTVKAVNGKTASTYKSTGNVKR